MFPIIAMAALKGAAIGAGLGAGGAALMGGDVKKGALLGAAGGGAVGGLAPLGQMAQFAGTPLGEAGAMATQFQRGLASAVGIGSAPTGSAGVGMAGKAGTQVGQSLASAAPMAAVSAATAPKPPEVSYAQDFGGGLPPRMAPMQEPKNWKREPLASGSILETFHKGLL